MQHQDVQKQVLKFKGIILWFPLVFSCQRKIITFQSIGTKASGHSTPFSHRAAQTVTPRRIERITKEIVTYGLTKHQDLGWCLAIQSLSTESSFPHAETDFSEERI